MGFFDIFKRNEPSDTEIQSAVNEVEIDYLETLPVQIPESTVKEINKLNILGGMASKVADAYLESKKINANIEALRTTTSAVVSMHAAQLANARECLTMVFAERSTALNKHYDVLERALKSDDRELIIASLQGISSIVVANPLDKVGEYIRALNNPKVPLQLDF
ncbi:MAG: enoyl-CoA hydratase/isomerase family protein [Barnesiella sp.]|nr:enoyl-CoA hydratase/isomerase family protein [Bacteroidales bacterium]MBD5248460.1 enoyl-CoA hydratase/isomerase family protein [Barnesiella sp.]